MVIASADVSGAILDGYVDGADTTFANDETDFRSLGT